MSKVILLQVINIFLLLVFIGFYLIGKKIKLRKGVLLTIIFFGLNALLLLFDNGVTYEILPYLVLLEFGILISSLLDKFKSSNIIALFIALCLFDSVVVYLQYFEILQQNVFSVFKHSGFYDNPSHKSGLYVITMSLLFWEYNKKKSKIFLFLLILFSITVGIGGARSAILSILLIFIGIYLHEQKSVKVAIILAVVVPLLISVFFFLYSIRENSFDNRLSIWGDSISQTISNKPIFGFGVGSFEVEFNKNRAENNRIDDKEIKVYEYINHPHNEYVKIFFEYGLVGFLLFLLIVALSIKYSWNSEYKEHFLIVLSSLLLLSLTQFPFQILLNWMFLVLVFLMINKESIQIKKHWVGMLLIIISLTSYISFANYELRKKIGEYAKPNNEYKFNYMEFNWFFRNSNLVENNSLLTLLNIFQNEGINYRVSLNLDKLKDRTSNPSYYILLGRRATLSKNFSHSINLYEFAYKLSTVHLSPLYELSTNLNKSKTPDKYIENICLYKRILERTYDKTDYISHYKLVLSMDSLPYECE